MAESKYHPVENTEKFVNAGLCFFRVVEMSDGAGNKYPALDIRFSKDLLGRAIEIVQANAILPSDKQISFSEDQEKLVKYNTVKVPVERIFPMTEFLNDIVAGHDLAAKHLEKTAKKS